MNVEDVIARLREIAERSPGCEVRVGLDPREPAEIVVEDVFESEDEHGSYAVIVAPR